MTGTNPIPVRLDDEIIDRLDRLAALLGERAAGAKVTRASALRVALDRGLTVLESELGASAGRRKPKK